MSVGGPFLFLVGNSHPRQIGHPALFWSMHDHRVTERFDEWQRCRANLRDKSQLLDQTMPLRTDDDEPIPSGLASEVKELRSQCESLFVRVLEAMNDRTLARGES